MYNTIQLHTPTIPASFTTLDHLTQITLYLVLPTSSPQFSILPRIASRLELLMVPVPAVRFLVGLMHPQSTRSTTG